MEEFTNSTDGGKEKIPPRLVLSIKNGKSSVGGGENPNEMTLTSPNTKIKPGDKQTSLSSVNWNSKLKEMEDLDNVMYSKKVSSTAFPVRKWNGSKQHKNDLEIINSYHKASIASATPINIPDQEMTERCKIIEFDSGMGQTGNLEVYKVNIVESETISQAKPQTAN